MDAADAWHSLVTHARELDVAFGDAQVGVRVTDDGWVARVRRGEDDVRVEGTHTHDLLTFLAYLARDVDASTPTPQIAQGEPFPASEVFGIAHSAVNASWSTMDGQRRLHVYAPDGPGDITSLLRFQSS